MNITRYVKKHSPLILTCIGAVGTVATAVMAVKATPKAMQLIEEAGYKKGSDTNPIEDMEFTPLTPAETVKVAWKPYIPAIITGTATIACIFGANVLTHRQQAALTSAYIFLDRSYREYKRKMVELYGKEADQNVQEAVAKERYEEKEHDFHPDGETLLFYEEHYGQYFERKMIEVMDAEYQLNRKLVKDGEVSLNDFFELLGLDHNEIGDALGWSQEAVCDFYNPSWIDFEHQLVKMEDGMECYLINMMVKPTAGYDVPF